MRVGTYVMTALLAASSAALAQAPLPQDQLGAGSYAERAVNGAQIAATWCDSCHMVRPTQGSDIAPTFAQIAQDRTPDQIRAFLANPHGGMPPIQLSNRQIDDVIAYMKSLNKGSDIAPKR